MEAVKNYNLNWTAIKTLMEERNLSFEKLSISMGYSHPYLTHAYRTQATPKLDALIKLSLFFRKPLKFFILENQPWKPPAFGEIKKEAKNVR